MLVVKHGRVAVILWAYLYVSVKGPRNWNIFYQETRIIIPKYLVKKRSREIQSISKLSEPLTTHELYRKPGG